MKFFVSYYDIEQDKVAKSECYSFSSGGEDFEFIPIRGKTFLPIIISCPKVDVGWAGFFTMTVVGYQKIKNSGYQKTTTTFFLREDSN